MSFEKYTSKLTFYNLLVFGKTTFVPGDKVCMHCIFFVVYRSCLPCNILSVSFMTLFEIVVISLLHFVYFVCCHYAAIYGESKVFILYNLLVTFYWLLWHATKSAICN